MSECLKGGIYYGNPTILEDPGLNLSRKQNGLSLKAPSRKIRRRGCDQHCQHWCDKCPEWNVNYELRSLQPYQGLVTPTEPRGGDAVVGAAF